jgi:hypothetical protein
MASMFRGSDMDSESQFWLMAQHGNVPWLHGVAYEQWGACRCHLKGSALAIRLMLSSGAPVQL